MTNTDWHKFEKPLAPEIKRRQTITAYAVREDITRLAIEEFDIQRRDARDVVHEILRDGCVCGELS